MEVIFVNDNPLMIMLVNMTIVFSILMLLWGVISVTGMIADRINEE